MTPFFSVITCTRNSASTLADTISSVRAQTNQDLEHIFVDGGSTDGTLQLIRDLMPTAIVLENVTGGISRAMNAGIHAAKGQVIVHLHSDDFFADKLVLARVAQVFSSDTVRWAVGDFEYLVHGKRVPGSRVAPLTVNRLGLGNYIPHPATFIRAKDLEMTGPFAENLRLCMDYDLWFRLFAKSEPMYIPHVLSVFRAHAGSVSTMNRRSTLLEEMRIRLRYIHIAPWTIPRYFYRFAKRWHWNLLVPGSTAIDDSKQV